MMTSKEDIGIFYAGGAGGFYILHMLLLSKEFDCSFEDNYTIEDVFGMQWKPLSDMGNWKDIEIWPDNKATYSMDSNKRKLYLYCYPSKEDIAQFNGVKLFVYMDSFTQFKLMVSKKAGLFRPDVVEKHANKWRTQIWNASEYTKNSSQTQDLSSLPEETAEDLIKRGYHLLLDEKTYVDYYIKYLSANVFGEDVYNWYKVFSCDSAINVNAKSVIADCGISLYQNLGIEYTDACKDFTQKYLNRHDDYTRSLLTNYKENLNEKY